MKSTQNLPEKLKELRSKNNYSQEYVADQIGVTRQAISRWETGRAFPDIDNLIQLSALYEVSVDELLNDGCLVNLELHPEEQDQKESHQKEQENEEENHEDHEQNECNLEPCVQDDLKDVTSIAEMLIFATILIIASKWYVIGIPIAIGIMMWLIYTRRNYRFLFVLCVLCLIANIYEVVVIYSHFSTFYGEWDIIPK